MILTKKYYLRRDDEEKGPCTSLEILSCDLNPTDMIWNEEWGEWKLAIDADEFKDHFSRVAPNVSIFSTSKDSSPDKVSAINFRRSKYVGLLIWSLVVIILLLIYYFFIQLF